MLADKRDPTWLLPVSCVGERGGRGWDTTGLCYGRTVASIPELWCRGHLSPREQLSREADSQSLMATEFFLVWFCRLRGLLLLFFSVLEMRLRSLNVLGKPYATESRPQPLTGVF